MRLAFAAAALLLGSILAASAQAPMARTPSVPGQLYDIPAGSAPQEVSIRRGEFAPGYVGPFQVHPGVEMTYVAQGDLQVTIGNNPPQVFHAGEALMIPRQAPHQSKNVGTVPVIVYVSFVLDKDQPVSQVVPAPTP